MTPLLAALVTIAADLTSAGAIGRPQPNFVKKESATSATSRSAAQAAGAGQSAGRSDRAAPLARAYRQRLGLTRKTTSSAVFTP
jgi:hypothetical protein